jgi:hypothetical protein
MIAAPFLLNGHNRNLRLKARRFPHWGWRDAEFSLSQPHGTIEFTQEPVMDISMSAAFAAFVFSSTALLTGPLVPPTGPVASSYKTLTEVEPRTAVNALNTPGDADSLFKISHPGSYYLTGNLTGVVGKHGIEIASSGVTLDLNGFEVFGFPVGGFDGVITTVVGLSNIAVLNGSVRNWSAKGIDLSSVPASGCRVDRILAGGNVGGGIDTGPGSIVSNCSIFANTSTGLTIGQGGRAFNCVAYSNTSTGISALHGSSVTECSVLFNGGNGITALDGCTITGCTLRANTLDGIRCSSKCVIQSNTSTSSGFDGDGAGIHATGGGNRIEGNT